MVKVWDFETGILLSDFTEAHGNAGIPCLTFDSSGRGYVPSPESFFFFNFIYLFILFIYFWLCWVFVAVRGLSLAVASEGFSSLWCTGFSLWWLLLLRSMGVQASVVVARGLNSCGTRA